MLDKHFGKIVSHLGEHPDFLMGGGLLYFMEQGLLCIPEAVIYWCCLAEIIIDSAHQVAGYMGHVHMLAYIE